MRWEWHIKKISMVGFMLPHDNWLHFAILAKIWCKHGGFHSVWEKEIRFVLGMVKMKMTKIFRTDCFKVSILFFKAVSSLKQPTCWNAECYFWFFHTICHHGSCSHMLGNKKVHAYHVPSRKKTAQRLTQTLKNAIYLPSGITGFEPGCAIAPIPHCNWNCPSKKTAKGTICPLFFPSAY